MLINIDSKITNFALKKVEKYYGVENCVWDIPLYAGVADKIYVSCIFTSNRKEASSWEVWGEKCFIGGTGYDEYIKLPPEIDEIKPKINWGFTTRGCIRKCHFCFVPRMEGKIHAVGDIYDLWDGISKDVILADNNILALPKHFKMICQQLRDNNLKVDFNQGLDARLINDDMLNELKTIRHYEYRFAWDGEDNLEDRFKHINKHLGQCLVYVYCDPGFDYDFIRYKCEKLKELGMRAYVMRDESNKKDKKYIELARWVNQPHIYKKMTLDEFRKADKKTNRWGLIGLSDGVVL